MVTSHQDKTHFMKFLILGGKILFLDMTVIIHMLNL